MIEYSLDFDFRVHHLRRLDAWCIEMRGFCGAIATHEDVFVFLCAAKITTAE